MLIYIAFISLTEVFTLQHKKRRSRSLEERIKLIQFLAVRIVESDENLNLMAGKLKATNTISLADAYISAVCQEYAGILVHKDPHFEKMSPLIKGYKLPYKTV